MPGSGGEGSKQALWTAGLLFALALVLRIFFLLALPEAARPHNPFYTGDTPTWLSYARAIQAGIPFDLGLPMRPPGVAYLIASIWDGTEGGLFALQLAWAAMGAVVVVLLFFAVLGSFGYRVATVAGFTAAISSGLMILSTSINNETPYLLLVLGSLALWQPLRHRPRWALIAAWSLLQGLACLIRVEHVLFVALSSLYLAWAWVRIPGQQGVWRMLAGRAILLAVVFLLPLVPWQLHIFSQIEQFNTQPLPTNRAAEQAYQELEQALAGLRWTEEAEQIRDGLPVFSQRSLGNFVAATVAMRGGQEVQARDLAIIEQAFGYRPEPISAYPFITVYGGLNFRLANNPWAGGGFTRAPLETPPPFEGGRWRYPAFLTAGLPPPDLAFSYPPHVEIVNHGYRLGWEWIMRHPGDFLSLALRKLGIFFSGTAQGFTGYNLPIGTSGIRRAVDTTVPETTPWTMAWYVFCAAILLGGLWAGKGREALVPWMFLLATKLVATVGFFGYAREGAVLIPLLALLFGLLVERVVEFSDQSEGGVNLADGSSVWVRSVCAAALLFGAVECSRWLSRPAIMMDGRIIEGALPYSALDYEERRLEVE